MRRLGLLVSALGVVAAGCHGLPEGMADVVTHADLVQPTSFSFAPDGRLFVAEQRGTIQTYDNVSDTTPTLFADLRTQVHNHHDRGLLGIEVDKGWPARPFVYAVYAYDAPVGQTAPVYGGVEDSDPCPGGGTLENPNGCPAQTRVVQLRADSTPVTVEQRVLLSDVCRQFQVHDGGGLRMAPNGRLIVGLGEGAWPNLDRGQYGSPANPCGDPANEGGSLRAQDARTPGDPAGLGGSVVAIDPDTGTVQQLAYGLRNPFRLTLRPGSAEAYVGDVGNDRAEEVNRIPDGGPVLNFGWPCYEGAQRQPDWDTLNNPVCENLYGAPAATTPPAYAYCHAGVAPNCEPGQGAVSGLAFYEGGPYADRYDGALFVADYTKSNITVVYPGPDGLPNFSDTEVFADELGGPVDLRTGPGGDLFYVDVFTGTLHRIYVGSPTAPPDQSTAPTAELHLPTGDEQLRVGEGFYVSGVGRSSTGQELPASAYRWTLVVQHCTGETTCHRHFVEDKAGVQSWGFTAPFHDGSYKLEVVMRVTDAGGSDQTSRVIVRQPS